MIKVKEYADRKSDAANAKAALLEKFRSAAKAPGLAKKLAVRDEVARLRDVRLAARKAEKQAEQQIEAAKAAAVIETEMQRRAEEAALIEAKQSAQAKRIALVLSDEAARKAARDLRYAKRKAGQLGAR